MNDLPVMLNLLDRQCVVIGGGAVGVRRARTLLAAGARVTLISPTTHPSMTEAPQLTGLKTLARTYQPGDLLGAMLVVIATDDPATNQAVADEARAAGVLVNRSDDPEASDVQMMAQAQHGPVTLAVHTQGVSASAAGVIKRELLAALAPHWPAMLSLAAPWRQRIQQAVTDTTDRQARLRALTGAHAIALYQSQGPDALETFYSTLANPSQPLTSATDITRKTDTAATETLPQEQP